ncbi:MAG: hypothetical protein IPO92_15100 [Saprospiraceae bacterium]|nr:hypothetical protein [Saprospiraceae bacterium]
MKNLFFTTLFLILNMCLLSGQEYCRPIFKLALAAYESNNLQDALRKLKDAESCDYKNILIKERQKLQDSIFLKVNEQRIEAIKSSDRAIENSKKAFKANLEANFRLAQLFEEKTSAALKNDEYAQAWLYNQEAIRLASMANKRLPLSAGRLMLREMCPCPEMHIPTPDKLNGPIIALTYDTSNLLKVVASNAFSTTESTKNDSVQITYYKSGNGIKKSLIRINVSEKLPALVTQSLSNMNKFVSLHRDESLTYLIHWDLINKLVPDTIFLIDGNCAKINNDGTLFAIAGKFGIDVSKETISAVISNEESKNVSPIDLAFSFDNKLLAGGFRDGRIVIWSLNKAFKNDHGHKEHIVKEFVTGNLPVQKLVFSPDGKYVAFGNKQGELTLIDIKKDIKFKITPFGQDQKQITSLTFSPDSKLLALGSIDGHMSICGASDHDKWEEIALLKAHKSEVTAIAFSPDGNMLSSGSKDSTVRQMSLRLSPFNVNRDHALDLSQFFFNYNTPAQAEKRIKIRNMSFKELPYKMEDINLRPKDNEDVFMFQLAQYNYFGGPKPFNAFIWGDDLKRDKLTKSWKENDGSREFIETERDADWIYIKEKNLSQNHQFRIPKLPKHSVQLCLTGDYWIDINLNTEIDNDSIIITNPMGLRFEPLDADWAGFRQGNSGGITFRIIKTDSLFFYMSNKDTLENGQEFHIKIQKSGGWSWYKYDEEWIRLFNFKRWNQIESTKDIFWEDRHFIYENVRLNKGSNYVEVNPSANINIEFDWETLTDKVTDAFCPSCFVQGYTGLKNVISKCYVSDILDPEYYVGDAGHENYNFIAPGKPGIYHITHRYTLDYFCKEESSKHSSALDEAIAVIRVLPSQEYEEIAEHQLTIEPETVEFVVDTFIRFQSVCKPKKHIHVETLIPEAGEIIQGWWSAQWVLENVNDGMNSVRIRNKWTSGYLNVEDYVLTQGYIEPDWTSAIWELEKINNTDFVRIKNRWMEGYLNIDSGKLQLSRVKPEKKCAWWKIQTVTE